MFAKIFKVISGLSIIAFSHKTTELHELGWLQKDEFNPSGKVLDEFKNAGISEFFFLNTCNRSEFIYVASPLSIADNRLSISSILLLLQPKVKPARLAALENSARSYHSLEALNHLIRVSCSLDSLVVGEKEILGQVREAYSRGRLLGHTGEIMRLVMDRVVKAAKEVYTHTKISQKPISVVSIAFRKLKSLNLSPDAAIVLVGAGKTNALFSKYLVKHGYQNFTIFNRTLDRAEALAKELNSPCFPLDQLETYTGHFDLLVVCTDSKVPLVTPELYQKLIQSSAKPGEKKILIDLSIPSNIDPQVIRQFDNHFIDIQSLQELAARNLDDRYHELFAAEKIIEENILDFEGLLRERTVALAMKNVPQQIKEIREIALSTIFAKDIDKMDEPSRQTLERVLSYMEKKYISIPMVLAKEILVHS